MICGCVWNLWYDMINVKLQFILGKLIFNHGFAGFPCFFQTHPNQTLGHNSVSLSCWVFDIVGLFVINDD